jgi:4-hydroxybenzoate polyprenyltransferase
MMSSLLPAVIRAMRPHQWAKNLLVFVPMILAQQYGADTAAKASLAFIAFCACASAVYLFNDMLDVRLDRLHPRKRHRPFANGTLGIQLGIALTVVLAMIALAVAYVANPKCAALVAGYFAANAVYSTWLKSQPPLDVIMLSGMYGLRLEMGAVATATPLSPWLLAFALFFFTSLAFSKRYVELRQLESAGGTEASGRGYRVADAGLIESLGPASGYVAVLVLALYMNSDQMHAIYGDGRLLWLLCPIVLYWITRIWFLAKRGELDDDPVVFALRDRASLVVAVLAAAVVAMATLAAGRSGG